MARQICVDDLVLRNFTGIASFTARLDELGFDNDSLKSTQFWDGIGEVELIALETESGNQFVLGAEEGGELTTIYVIGDPQMACKLNELLASLPISEFEWRLDDDPEEMASRISLYQR